MRSHPANWFWGFSVLCALVVVVPFLVLYRTGQPLTLGAPVVLATFSVAYCGAHLAVLAVRGQKEILTLTFWVFAYAWLGVAPLAQLSSGRFPWPAIYSEDAVTYALAIVLVGYVSYDVGRWAGARRFTDGTARLVARNLSVSKLRVYALGLLATVVATAAAQKFGGFGVLLVSTRFALEQEVTANFVKSDLLVWSTLLRVPAFVSLVLLCWVWINRGRLAMGGWEKLGCLLFLALLLALNAVVNNPLGQARLFFGTVVLTIMFIALGWSGRYSMGAWAAGLVSALLVVFPYADVFRQQTQVIELEPVATQLAANGDYDAFQELTNVVTFVNSYGELPIGRQWLGALLFWVPRSTWPDKPVGSGQFVSEQLGYSFTNVSAPLWAEGYINAGLLGVILTFLLYGFATSVLQTAYVSSYDLGPTLLGMLVPIFAGYQIYFLRGDLMSAIAYGVPILGWCLLAASTKRVTAPAGRSGRRLVREAAPPNATRRRERVLRFRGWDTPAPGEAGRR